MNIPQIIPSTTSPLFVLVIALCLSFTNVHAQISLGGFAGPIALATHVDGESAFLAGGGAALMIGSHLYVGLYGTAMSGRIARSIQMEEFQIGYTQIGIWTGAIINPTNKLQATVNTYLGMARLAAQDNSLKDRTVQLGPHIGIQYAVLEFMRIEVLGGYRFSTKANKSLFENSNLHAPFGGINLKFGDFN
ncbi:MAG: hypothetical protein ACI959_000924 [Limisphaerales bacterium]|jgi:hypothetical protein